MTAASFDPTAFNFVIAQEGKWDNDRRDRGNWTSGVIGEGELKGTKYGVAAHAYPNLDIKNLTLADAKTIQKRDYWDKVAGDTMPAGVDLSVFDMAYNAGPARSLAILKKALGSAATTAAGLAMVASVTGDKVGLIKAFAAMRLSFYQGLKTFVTYGRGWSRRAAECEALSVRLALTATTLQPAQVKNKLQTEQKAAAKSAVGHGSAGGTTVTGGSAGGAQHDWVFGWDWLTVFEVAAVAVLAGIALYFLWYTLAHNDRARAYAAVAA